MSRAHLETFRQVWAVMRAAGLCPDLPLQSSLASSSNNLLCTEFITILLASEEMALHLNVVVPALICVAT